MKNIILMIKTFLASALILGLLMPSSASAMLSLSQRRAAKKSALAAKKSAQQAEKFHGKGSISKPSSAVVIEHTPNPVKIPAGRMAKTATNESGERIAIPRPEVKPVEGTSAKPSPVVKKVVPRSGIPWVRPVSPHSVTR